MKNKTISLMLSLATFLMCGIATAPVAKGRLNISVTNAQRSPVENATIELRKVKDSSLVKASLTDKEGNASFDVLPGKV